MQVYNRKEILEITQVLPEVVFETPIKGKKGNHQVKIINGDKINMASWRYQTFVKSGLACVSCGLVASYFAKETLTKNNRFHLNLYGIKDNQEVLFTKDHIFPKSKGGTDSLDNFQTMCSPCNALKSDKI